MESFMMAEQASAYERVNHYLQVLECLQDNDPSFTTLRLDDDLWEPLFHIQGAVLSFCRALHKNRTIATVIISGSVNNNHVPSPYGSIIRVDPTADATMKRQVLQALNRVVTLECVDLGSHESLLLSAPIILKLLPRVTHVRVLVGMDVPALHLAALQNSLQQHTNLHRFSICTASGTPCTPSRILYHCRELCHVVATTTIPFALDHVTLSCPGGRGVLDEHCLQSLVTKCRSLHLQGWILSEESNNVLTTALMKDTPLLTSLTLEECCLPDATPSWAWALSYNDRLQTLQVEDCFVPHVVYFDLAKGLAANQSLQTFALKTVFGVSTDDLIIILHGLANSTSITHVTLPSCHEPWDTRLDPLFQQFLHSCQDRLIQLNVGCRYNSLSPRVAACMTQLCSTASRLQSVHVVDMKQEDLVNLIFAIPWNTSLVHVSVTSNHVSLRALEQILHRTAQHPTLRLSMNLRISITDDSCCDSIFLTRAQEQDLVELAHTNYVIERLDLHGLNFADYGHPQVGSKLYSVLALNRAGRRYVISDPSNIDKGLKVLGQVSHDLDSIFVHVRENPSLLNLS